MRLKVAKFETGKECALCHVFKDLSAYHQNLQNADGKHSYCKKCRNDAKKTSYALKRAEREAINREYIRKKQEEFRREMRESKA